MHFLLSPYVPTRDDPFSRDKAAHLLNRAGFGGTEDEISRVLELGPAGAVDWLLSFKDQSAEEQTPDDLPDMSSIEGMPTNFRAYRRMLQTKTEAERKTLVEKLMMANRQVLLATSEWWLNRMASGPFPLQEKLTLFWHGHFTTSARDERSALLMWKQNELHRGFAAGNFYHYVKSVSRDPAMLDYLNNTQNHKRQPNENYARELMELFTLGIGSYTEYDIREAARAFTGWSHDGEEYAFRPFDHDDGEKSFFGQKGNWDGDDIIHMICSRKRCAQYIANRIYAHFVSEDDDDAIVQSLGEVLWDARYELRPMLKVMFTSKAFYRPQVMGAQIKSPLQLVVGTVRTLGLKMPEGASIRGALNQMGQVPFMPPNVKGWPGGRAWINTSTLFARYNLAMRLVGAAEEVHTAPTSKEVVNHYLSLLLVQPLAEEKRRFLNDALDGRPQDPNAVKRMIQLIVSMPEYQLC